MESSPSTIKWLVYVGVPRDTRNLLRGTSTEQKLRKNGLEGIKLSAVVIENFHLVLLKITCLNFPENERTYLLFAGVSYFLWRKRF